MIIYLKENGFFEKHGKFTVTHLNTGSNSPGFGAAARPVNN